MQAFHKAARGELENFVLVVEGSILNEKLTGGGYWAAMGSDPKTGQPITTSSIAGLLAGTEVLFAFACKESRVKETELVSCSRRHAPSKIASGSSAETT